MSERNSRFKGPIKQTGNSKVKFAIIPLGVNDSVNEISQDKIDKATALQDHLAGRSASSILEYMNSRNLSDNWRETFKLWGYEPCLD